MSNHVFVCWIAGCSGGVMKRLMERKAANVVRWADRRARRQALVAALARAGALA